MNAVEGGSLSAGDGGAEIPHLPPIEIRDAREAGRRLIPAQVTRSCDVVLPWMSGGDPLIGPCPHWCDDIGLHRNFEHHDDRRHHAETLTLPLELGNFRIEDNEDGEGEVWLDVLRLNLIQHYREIEPRIYIGMNDDWGIEITIAEAKALVGMLNHQLAADESRTYREFQDPKHPHLNADTEPS